MVAGLSFRSAAARVGCTHRSISVAVKHGRIPLLPDGTLAPEMVDKWHAGRRAKRGGAHRQVSAATVRGFRYPASSQPFFDAPENDVPPSAPAYRVPRAISNLSAFMHGAAIDLAAAAARHLPPDLATDMAQEWFRGTRAAWVGPGDLEPMSHIDGWPPPPTCGTWAEHPLFTENLATVDLDEALREGAAWRAKQGLPPL